MRQAIVYGSGCSNCEKTAELLQQVAEKLGVEVTVTKETDHAKIAMAGVMRTPAVAIDGKLVHAGGVPRADALEGWLSA